MPEKKEGITGACPFCGQTQIVDAEDENEANRIAAENCACDNKMKYVSFDEARALFKALLILYEAAERQAISELSMNIRKSEEELEEKCKEYLAEFDELDTILPIRPRGHWIESNNIVTRYYDALGVNNPCFCSACNQLAEHESDYCPNCGCQMNGNKANGNE